MFFQILRFLLYKNSIHNHIPELTHVRIEFGLIIIRIINQIFSDTHKQMSKECTIPKFDLPLINGRFQIVPGSAR